MFDSFDVQKEGSGLHLVYIVFIVQAAFHFVKELKLIGAFKKL